ncbi:CapA family protein [Kineosporia sp. A_224]|uniref:CapA family protein n=1 Tax=Kineosporia sp. A_224 TaxID=1962180 RepID=UPI001304433E|nr:CapA family protein [Kineosporia sp. A_224]
MRRARLHLATCTVLLAVVLGGCGLPGGGPDAGTAAPATSAGTAAADDTASGPTTAPTPEPTPSATPAGPRRTTLAFAGDVHFANQVADVLDDPQTGLAELQPYLSTADLAMVNLETAITTRGQEMPKKFHFRAPATAFAALAAAGVDVVTLANNHAVDYGEVGLRDTLAARAKAPIPAVGLGKDAADAYAPAILDVDGAKVAVLGATQVPDWTLATWPARPGRPGVAAASDPARLAAAVRAARKKADVVVVYLHWGTDYTTCPNALQKRTARALADAGADVVVGAHAHRLQGAGWLGDTYVSYGLGNFVWWRRNSVADATTGVLTLGVEGRRVVSARWTPMLVSADGIPRVPDAAASKRMRQAWDAARDCTGLAARPAG